MPGRSFTSGTGYRYGFNGQEKVDEICGTGNHNTALFWEYDTRFGRRWNLDPKPKPNASNYNCLENSPISYFDLNGDSSEFMGTEHEISTMTASLNKGFDAKVSFDYIKDKNGQIVGAKYFDAKPDKNDPTFNDLRSYLKSVLNSKEMVEIEKYSNLSKHVDDIELFGGIMYKPECNKLVVSDQWFTGKWEGSGLENQPSYDYMNKAGRFMSFRKIEFSEALVHEIIHAYRDLHHLTKWYVPEENAVRFSINIWLEKNNLPKRGLLRTANWWESRWGKDYMEDIYEY